MGVLYQERIVSKFPKFVFQPTNLLLLRGVIKLQDGSVLGAHSHGLNAGLPRFPALGDVDQDLEQAMITAIEIPVDGQVCPRQFIMDEQQSLVHLKL